MESPCAILLVFAKAPFPGQAKTRLIPALGEKGAARLHARLVRHCLAIVIGAKEWKAQLWCTPTSQHPFFRRCRREFGVPLHTQQGWDLGDRMNQAVAQALQQAPYVIIIGTDCPVLSQKDISTALEALQQGRQAVLVPAFDGGYVLLGLRQVDAYLFDGIPWGESSVLELTRRRLEKLQWHWCELPAHWDVDRPEDLEYPLVQALLHENKSS